MKILIFFLLFPTSLIALEIAILTNEYQKINFQYTEQIYIDFYVREIREFSDQIMKYVNLFVGINLQIMSVDTMEFYEIISGQDQKKSLYNYDVIFSTLSLEELQMSLPLYPCTDKSCKLTDIKVIYDINYINVKKIMDEMCKKLPKNNFGIINYFNLHWLQQYSTPMIPKTIHSFQTYN